MYHLIVVIINQDHTCQNKCNAHHFLYLQKNNDTIYKIKIGSLLYGIGLEKRETINKKSFYDAQLSNKIQAKPQQGLVEQMCRQRQFELVSQVRAVHLKSF